VDAFLAAGRRPAGFDPAGRRRPGGFSRGAGTAGTTGSPSDAVCRGNVLAVGTFRAGFFRGERLLVLFFDLFWLASGLSSGIQLVA